MTESTNPLKPEYAGVKLTLDNCLFPLSQINVTPSQKDGLDIGVEENLRFLGCEYIQISGIMLKMPQVAMATAQVLFQRYFFIKSFVKNKMEDLAMACIWLASKVEEAPRRVRDVMNVFHYLRQKRLGTSSPSPMLLDENYIMSKNNVIKAERRLLKELGFCVHVKHPHKIIVVYLQVLEMEKNRKLVQTAWNYMNDSLRTSVFVKHTPETIACACIYLAARVLRIPLPNQPHWFYLFNATEEEIQKISLTLLGVYQHKKADHDELEKQVDIRRKVLHEEKMKAKEAAGQVAEVTNSAANSPDPPTNISPFTESTSPKGQNEVNKAKEIIQNKLHRSREKDRSHDRDRSRERDRSRDRDSSQTRHRDRHRASSEGQLKRRDRDRSREAPQAKHRHRERSHESSKMKDSKRREREKKRDKHSRKRH